MFRQAKPMDNTAGTIFHRKRMARILLERALREIAESTSRCVNRRSAALSAATARDGIACLGAYAMNRPS
jgi:hypothetical protein